MPNIRHATLADARNLARIAELTFRQTFASDNAAENLDVYCRNKYSEALQAREISDPAMLTLLCELHGDKDCKKRTEKDDEKGSGKGSEKGSEKDSEKDSEKGSNKDSSKSCHNRAAQVDANASELAGFAQLRWGNSPDCVIGARPGELQRLYVLESWHGQGIAQQLMQASIEAMQQRGSDCLWLGVWECNYRALAFYKKAGFVAVGEHVFHLGSSAQRDLLLTRAV